MQSLTDLLALSAIDASVEGDADVTIRSITADSRKVDAGALFAAVTGVKQDGVAYIDDAIEKGAAAIMLQHKTEKDNPQQATFVRVDHVRHALARMAAAFYGAQPKHLVAITGTNGKTSTAEFFRQLWVLEGKKAASIGTLGLRSGDAARDAQYPANNTSPDPVMLSQMLADLKQGGVDYVALEASSHGLDQYRLDGVKIRAAAYTNISRDHLDYHADMDNYFAAKARLFTQLEWSGNVAVIHADDARADELQALCLAHGREVRSYGQKGNYLTLHQVQPTAQGLDVSLTMAGENWQGTVPLFGLFQIDNVCAALCLAVASGMSVPHALAHIKKLQGVRGRMECVAHHPGGAPVFVDYAHTPDALKNVLISLRAHTTGKLHVVFGCGGDRDAGKRPLMGQVAADYADVVVVTDDNPRSENPAAIRAAIRAAVPQATEMGNRTHAIRHAITHLGEGDVLVVAGKGHETYQIIGEVSEHFDDAEQIREAIATL